MNVLLVHAPRLVRRADGLESCFVNIPAMGLYGICSHLERSGHRATLLHHGVKVLSDPDYRLDRYVVAGGYGLVGISMHWHHQVPGTLDLAAEIKRGCPGVRVVVGGLTASRFAREILERSDDVDWVVRGDGEAPMAALATALERGQPVAAVPNLVHRTPDGIVANPRGFVADEAFWAGLSYAETRFFEPWGEARQPYYFDPVRQPVPEYFDADVFYLQVGRGCTYGCCYCGGSAAAHRTLANRKSVAFRPVADVVSDLRKVADAGYRCAYFCFDPPPRASAYFLDLFARLRGERLPIGLEFEAYQPHGRAFWEAMAGAFEPGRSLVVFSPDTESEAVRRRVKGYGYTNEALEADIAHLHDLGFKQGLYLSVCPFEDADQARRTAAWMRDLRRRYGVPSWVHAIEIEPTSAWLESPAAWGLSDALRTFEDFERWHRSGPPIGGTAVGYRMEGLEERFRLLKEGESD